MAKKPTEQHMQTSSETQDRSKADVQALLVEMPLNALRRARGLSQRAVADLLHVQQPTIAKMERRTDMYISTLRSYIEAMGGELEVIARFPAGAVKVANFSGLSDAKSYQPDSGPLTEKEVETIRKLAPQERKFKATKDRHHRRSRPRRARRSCRWLRHGSCRWRCH